MSGPDLIDYLRDNLDHADDVVCTCPACEVTTLADLMRGERKTKRGYDFGCAIHGTHGTQPTFRKAAP